MLDEVRAVLPDQRRERNEIQRSVGRDDDSLSSPKRRRDRRNQGLVQRSAGSARVSIGIGQRRTKPFHVAIDRSGLAQIDAGRDAVAAQHVGRVSWRSKRGFTSIPHEERPVGHELDQRRSGWQRLLELSESRCPGRDLEFAAAGADGLFEPLDFAPQRGDRLPLCIGRHSP